MEDLKPGQAVTYLDHDGETRIPAFVVGVSMRPNPIPGLKIQPFDRRSGNTGFPGPYYDIKYVETNPDGTKSEVLHEYVPQVTEDMRTDELQLAGVVVA